MATCVPSTNAAIKKTVDKILARQPHGTFKSKRGVRGARPSIDFCSKATETLGSSSLKNAVRLPDQEDPCEWYAANVVDFFNQLNMLYGTLTEACSEKTCPVMCAGGNYQYYWSEPVSRKVIKCSAPVYVDYLMCWVQSQLEDEAIFPTKVGVPFPADFEQIVKTIFKRLFRIYAHVYYAHFDQIQALKEDAHLNTSFKHFMLFVNEFDLIDTRELEPLADLILSLLNKDVKAIAQQQSPDILSKTDISTSNNNSNEDTTKAVKH